MGFVLYVLTEDVLGPVGLFLVEPIIAPKCSLWPHTDVLGLACLFTVDLVFKELP